MIGLRAWPWFGTRRSRLEPEAAGRVVAGPAGLTQGQRRAKRRTIGVNTSDSSLTRSNRSTAA